MARVFAAFGLAAVIGHFWHIGWRGVLETLVGVWDQTVRPVCEWFFHVFATVPLTWIGLTVEVPLWLRDYLAVGLILMSSTATVARQWRNQPQLSPRLPRLPLGIILLWPLTLAINILDVFVGLLLFIMSKINDSWLGPSSMSLFAISPVIYLGVLLAVNTWLL